MAVPMSAAESTQEKRTFASFKFDWMKALAADPSVSARAKIIGNCILGHINQYSWEATLSDQAISDETAIALRWIVEMRNSLRASGWIDWRRTGGANVYWVMCDHMPAMQQRLAKLKAKRNAEALKRKTERGVRQRAAERNPRGVQQQVAGREIDPANEIRKNTPSVSQGLADYVQQQTADKHLSLTPTSTPKGPPRFAQRALTRASDLEEEKEEPTTIDQWLATTSGEERTADLIPFAESIGLTREQAVTLSAEFLDHHQSTNEMSDQWLALCRNWFRTHARRFSP
jgi:hypothetical protein